MRIPKFFSYLGLGLALGLSLVLPKSASAETVTTSLYGGTVYINSDSANYNFKDDVNLSMNSQDGLNEDRILLKATVPSGTGTITSAKISMLQTDCSNNFLPIEMREVTNTNWNIDEVTWNQYSSGNLWDNPGADFTSQVISTSTYDCDTDLVWQDFWIMGGNATNPVNLNWGDTKSFILQGTGGFYGLNTWYSFQEAATGPVLTIEYTP